MPQKNHGLPELARLREKRDEAERKCEQAEHNLQRIENRKKYLEDSDRKKRTHRLCVRAGALESMVPELKGLTDAECFTLMENVTALPEFHHELYLIVKQREEESSDGSVPFPCDAD